MADEVPDGPSVPPSEPARDAGGAADRQPPESRFERLNVNVTERTGADLRRLAARRGTTITETVRRAVALLAIVEDQVERGREIRVVDPQDQTTHVLHLL